MVFRGVIRSVVSGAALLALGAIGLAAFQNGLWGTLLGSALASVWIITLLAWRETHRDMPDKPAAEILRPDGESPYRLVLEQVPVPLLDIRSDQVRALNRAARSLFESEDRVIPSPSALIDVGAHHFLYRGRRFRIDRIEMDNRMVAALIDVEAEERTAEARATAEMIQVLGHEMLNGLAPIVSLAESGLAAIEAPVRRDDLLPEILGTLGRRAEGLLRFSEAYRSMARLPEPIRRPVALKTVADDLARLFAGRWADRVTLKITFPNEGIALLDGDQITQAVWALIQNGAEAALAGTADPSVSLSFRLEAGRLLLDVGDTGAGVAPEDAIRIFRPFHTTKPDGTGVGLSLARQIALAHGGELALSQSEPAIFQIEIPCASVGRLVHERGAESARHSIPYS